MPQPLGNPHARPALRPISPPNIKRHPLDDRQLDRVPRLKRIDQVLLVSGQRFDFFPGNSTLRAVMPCLRALNFELPLPSAVRGPVLRLRVPLVGRALFVARAPFRFLGSTARRFAVLTRLLPLALVLVLEVAVADMAVRSLVLINKPVSEKSSHPMVPAPATVGQAFQPDASPMSHT